MVSYIAHTSNGYFSKDVRVFVDKRLPGMEYAQAGILYEPAAEFLVSYETIVAEITADRWVHVYGLFSATTRKHLARWGRIHGLSYSELKWAYENGSEINVQTGRVRKAPYVPARTIGVAV